MRRSRFVEDQIAGFDKLVWGCAAAVEFGHPLGFTSTMAASGSKTPAACVKQGARTIVSSTC